MDADHRDCDGAWDVGDATMKDCVCKDCEKRHIGCHGSCEDYKAFVERIKSRKEKVKEGKAKDRNPRRDWENLSYWNRTERYKYR